MPWMMLVAWPVRQALASDLTGSYSVPVQYSVQKLRAMARMMPTRQVQAARMSNPSFRGTRFVASLMMVGASAILSFSSGDFAFQAATTLVEYSRNSLAIGSLEVGLPDTAGGAALWCRNNMASYDSTPKASAKRVFLTRPRSNAWLTM